MAFLFVAIMKNQQVILMLATLTMGMIMVLFVIDFISPKRASLGTVNLVEKKRTSLFGAKTSSSGLFNNEGKKADKMDALENKLDVIAQKLDRIANMIEPLVLLAGPRSAISRSSKSIGNTDNKHRRNPLSSNSSHSPVGGTHTGKVITPFAQLYNPNKKREESQSMGSLAGRNGVLPGNSSLSNGVQRGSYSTPFGGVGDMRNGDSKASTRLDMADATTKLPLNTKPDTEEAKLKSGDEDSILPGNFASTHGSNAGRDPLKSTGSKDETDPRPVSDNLDKFIGELLGGKFGEMTEATHTSPDDEGKLSVGDGGKDSNVRTFGIGVPLGPRGDSQDKMTGNGRMRESKIPSFGEGDKRNGAEERNDSSALSGPASDKGNEASKAPSTLTPETPKDFAIGNFSVVRSYKIDQVKRVGDGPLNRDEMMDLGGVDKLSLNGSNESGKNALGTSTLNETPIKKHLYLEDEETSVATGENESADEHSSSGGIRLPDIGIGRSKRGSPLASKA